MPDADGSMKMAGLRRHRIVTQGKGRDTLVVEKPDTVHGDKGSAGDRQAWEIRD